MRLRWPGRPTNPSTAATLPTLTVVMPVFNVAPYVREAIRAVLGQEGVAVTLVVVDDGSTDDTWRIVSRLARKHPNLIADRQDHAGQGAARNRALGGTRGTYLAFADGDDVVPQGAYAAMVSSLQETGSDLCLGGVRRFDTERMWEPAWSREVHAQDRAGVTLEEYLPAIKDILACNRVMRRDFWDRIEARFPEGVAYEDHWPMLHTLVRAKAIDILSRPVYHWRARPDGSSTGQQKHVYQNLLDRLTVKEDAWNRLREAPVAVQQAWVGRVLDVDLPPFITQALEADDQYRSSLESGLTRYTGLATVDAWSFVRGQNRARAVLVAEGRWAEVLGLAERIAADGVRALTVIEDGGVRLGADALPAGSLPASMRELPTWQSRLSARLTKTVGEDGGYRLHGVLAVEGLRLGGYRAAARAFLEIGSGARKTVLPVELRARQVRRAQDAELVDDVVTLAFQVLVPPTTQGDAEAGGVVSPRLRLHVESLIREGPIRVPEAVAASAVTGCDRDAAGFLVLGLAR